MCKGRQSLCCSAVMTFQAVLECFVNCINSLSCTQQPQISMLVSGQYSYCELHPARLLVLVSGVSYVLLFSSKIWKCVTCYKSVAQCGGCMICVRFQERFFFCVIKTPSYSDG